MKYHVKYLLLCIFQKIFETKKGPDLREFLVSTQEGSDQVAVVEDRISGVSGDREERLTSLDCLEDWERGLRLGEARLVTSAASECARDRESHQGVYNDIDTTTMI